MESEHMSLNIKALRKLEDLAREQSADEALKFIDNIPLAHSQPYLKAEYIKYFYSVKREYAERAKYGN